MLISKEVLVVIGRSILVISVLFLVTKILGKKQISQLTLYDYIIGITIGSLAADAVITLDETITYGLVSIMTCGILGYGLSYLAIKSTKANEILNGRPLILMKNGNFLYDNLKKSKISIAKFVEQSRLNGIYDISLLDCAILETNGQISFLPKEEYQNCDVQDFKANVRSRVSKQSMCDSLILDKEICQETLIKRHKDEKWLMNELAKLDVNKEDVILATIDEKDKIKVFEMD